MVKKLVLTMMAVVMVTGCAACSQADKNSASADTNKTVTATNDEVAKDEATKDEKENEPEVATSPATENNESELPEDYSDDLYNIELNRLHIGSAGLAAITFYVENNSKNDIEFGNDLTIEKVNDDGKVEKIENVTATGETVKGKEFKEVEVTINSESVIGNGTYRVTVMGITYDIIIDSFEE